MDLMDNLIIEYYDKSFISSLLCELSYGFYSFLYQLIIFPTILSSSILTVLNSSDIDKDVIKIINIIVNGINTIRGGRHVEYLVNAITKKLVEITLLILI